ncbi:hypothetical protein HN51_066404 [Arachis hypogaea]
MPWMEEVGVFAVWMRAEMHRSRGEGEKVKTRNVVGFQRDSRREVLNLVLTDFGLAKEFTESARLNSMCRTLEYIALEIFIGRGHDKPLSLLTSLFNPLSLTVPPSLITLPSHPRRHQSLCLRRRQFPSLPPRQFWSPPPRPFSSPLRVSYFILSPLLYTLLCMFVASSHPIGRSRRLPLTTSRRSRGLSLLQSSSTSTWLQLPSSSIQNSSMLIIVLSLLISAPLRERRCRRIRFCHCLLFATPHLRRLHCRQILLLSPSPKIVAAILFFSLMAKLVARCSACSPWPPFEEAANGSFPLVGYMPCGPENSVINTKYRGCIKVY